MLCNTTKCISPSVVQQRHNHGNWGHYISILTSTTILLGQFIQRFNLLVTQRYSLLPSFLLLNASIFPAAYILSTPAAFSLTLIFLINLSILRVYSSQFPSKNISGRKHHKPMAHVRRLIKYFVLVLDISRKCNARDDTSEDIHHSC